MKLMGPNLQIKHEVGADVIVMISNAAWLLSLGSNFVEKNVVICERFESVLPSAGSGAD